VRLLRLFKNELAKETAEWVDDEIISPAQAQQICQRYGADYHQDTSRSLGYRVLVGLGFLFIGLAVITLLSANWEQIPRAVRMGGLIATTLLIHGVGLQRFIADDRSGAVGYFFLGYLFYGASIILIAQIYHLGEHMPDGIFWWALGGLPIALLLNSSLLMLMTLLLASLWFLLDVTMGFYPLSFPVFFMASAVVLIRGAPSLLLFLTTIASAVFWLEVSLAALWREHRHLEFLPEHLGVSVALFLLLYAFGAWLANRSFTPLWQQNKAQDYGAVLSLWALRFGLLTMLVMSFEDPWSDLIGIDKWHQQSTMIGIITVLSLLSVWLLKGSRKLLPFSVLSLLSLGALAIVILSNDRSYAVVLQVLFNLALIGMGIWLIVRGIQGAISHYFFLGIATILLTAFLRYIDLIGDYVGGAMLFGVFAVVLLGAARYWRYHQERELAASPGSSGQAGPGENQEKGDRHE